jgi:hypothetical protein
MKQYEYNVLTNRYHVKEEVLNLLGKEEGLISTSDNTTEWISEVRNGITIHQSKPKKDI